MINRHHDDHRPENEGVQKGLQNHPHFIPQTSRFQSLTNHVQKEFFPDQPTYIREMEQRDTPHHGMVIITRKLYGM